MKRIKISLNKDVAFTMPAKDDIPHFERDFRIHTILPKYCIFIINESNPSRSWFNIITAAGYAVPGLYKYAMDNLGENANIVWNTALYPHNKITDNHDNLIKYLHDNIDNHVGTILDRALHLHEDTGEWEVTQALYDTADDLVAEYKVSYIPRLRHIERITNITFTDKFIFDKNFRPKCRD